MPSGLVPLHGSFFELSVTQCHPLARLPRHRHNIDLGLYEQWSPRTLFTTCVYREKYPPEQDQHLDISE